MSNAQPRVDADNDRVRVTTWTFQDGEATGHHRHEFDYIVVPITGGRFVVTDNDGCTRELTQQPGSPYLGVAGTEHDVTNQSGRAAIFVEVELKG